MKKKSTSQSAFLNLRVLLGLILGITGVFIALLGSGAFSNASAQANAMQEPKAQQFQTEIPTLIQPVPAATPPSRIRFAKRALEPVQTTQQ
jgi:hypothetical protein